MRDRRCGKCGIMGVEARGVAMLELLVESHCNKIECEEIRDGRVDDLIRCEMTPMP